MTILARKQKMAKQNYENHRRYYSPHHFIFYPLAFALFVLSVYYFFNEPGKKIEWFAIASTIFLVIWLSFMLRQHYAMRPQNRIIRLEMRLRYFQLFGKKFDPVESRLSFRQIAALRFASDEELPGLLERTLEENLSAKSIKKLITEWRPDHMRV